MTNPRNRAQGGSGDNESGGSFGRILLILAGMAAAAFGLALILQSYSTHPPKFYFGLALLVVGGGTAAYLSLKQDRRKQHPNKRNGDSTRRRNA